MMTFAGQNSNYKVLCKHILYIIYVNIATVMHTWSSWDMGRWMDFWPFCQEHVGPSRKLKEISGFPRLLMVLHVHAGDDTINKTCRRKRQHVSFKHYRPLCSMLYII